MKHPDQSTGRRWRESWLRAVVGLAVAAAMPGVSGLAQQAAATPAQSAPAQQASAQQASAKQAPAKPAPTQPATTAADAAASPADKTADKASDKAADTPAADAAGNANASENATERTPEQRRLDAQMQERKNQLAVDTANLLRLANELKAEMDKSSKDTLSVNVVKKADEVEKLAHKVRDEMKATMGN